MKVISRAYRGEADLTAMQSALAHWIHDSNDCGYLHVGDIPHRLYNGMRGRYPLNDVVRLWLLDDVMIGFAIVSPRRSAYEVQVAPDHRGGDIEREMLVWAEERCLQWMERAEVSGEALLTEYVDGDEIRLNLLRSLGYILEDTPALTITERSLAAIPDPILPDGYTIRPAQMDECAQLAAVHSASFGSDWTADTYHHVMESPGYDVERELVVVAPDGTFAAFCIYWLDEINKVGLLEPVGTHKDFRRLGLSRALNYYALCQMRAAGMEHAQVLHENDNEASTALYAAVGFERKYDLFDCKKTLA